MAKKPNKPYSGVQSQQASIVAPKKFSNGLIENSGHLDLLKDKELHATLEKDQQALHRLEQYIKELLDSKSRFELQREQLNIQSQELTKAKVLFDEERIDLETAQLSFNQQQTLYMQNKAYLDEQQKSHQQKSLQLSLELDQLAALKRSAELGFAEEKQAAIREKGKELEELHVQHLLSLQTTSAEIELKKKNLYEREQLLIVRESTANAGFLEEQKNIQIQFQKDMAIKKEQQEAELILKLEEIQNRQNELDNALDRIHAQKLQLEAMEKRLDLDKQKQASWEKAKQEEIQERFELQIKELNRSLELAKDSRQKAFDRIDDLLAKLAQFEDLQRQLDEQDIGSLQDEMQSLRLKNSELRNELGERKEEGLFEENQRLREQKTTLEQSMQKLDSKYTEVEAERGKLKRSAIEHLNLMQEKKVLDNHKRLMDSHIQQLTEQIDDLEARQHGKSPFPALSGMDDNISYGQPAVGLQPIYDLAKFARQMRAGIAKQKLFYSDTDIRLFIAGLAMSKLHLLQGMSGTGKTSLARAFAKAINNIHHPDEKIAAEHEEQYCSLVRVQAGWRDREDLLGHFNAFEKRFYEQEALKALYRAQQPKFADTVQIILLDEMNLSQPEQYFAEFLSVLETPDRSHIDLLTSPNDKAPRMFGGKKSIKVPNNVWFIGTANHDETTKEFADKTYDRAHVMEIKRSKQEAVEEYQPTSYSFKSLQEQFDSVCKTDEKSIQELFHQLGQSDLSKALGQIKIGWGNRLERNAKSFIPVFQATGGTRGEALDHLLATKLFRSGKVTGRYDTNEEKIKNIMDALEKTWTSLNLPESPYVSIGLLEDDIKRFQQGGV